MGKLRLVAAIMFIGACGSKDSATIDAPRAIDAAPQPDSKVFMDAPPPMYDFSCMTNAAPANGSATATITLSGLVTEVAFAGMTPSFTPLDGATLNACKAGAANCDVAAGNRLAGPVTSAGGGMFSLGPIANASTNPLDFYLTMVNTGDRSVDIFPPQPIAMDLANIPVLTFTNQAFGLAQIAANTQQSGTKGNIVIGVTDCANMPVDGATVTLQQNGAAVVGATDLDAGSLSPMAAGAHVVFNVPVGDTTVNATFMNMTFHAHVVKSIAGVTSETIVRPGYF